MKKKEVQTKNKEKQRELIKFFHEAYYFWNDEAPNKEENNDKK